MLFLSLLLAIATPQNLANRFCTAYLKQHEYGLLEGRDRRVMAPFLSARLLRQLDDARACQRDWYRQQPKGSTDKPPFVDCCLFSSTPDGMPTSYSIGETERLADGRYKIVVNYRRKTKTDDIRWRDALIVKKERGRYVVDDVIYDLERPSYLSKSFGECRGRHYANARRISSRVGGIATPDARSRMSITSSSSVMRGSVKSTPTVSLSSASFVNRIAASRSVTA